MNHQKIWVLGEQVKKADKCILWGDTIPNLSNCDTLIINFDNILIPSSHSSRITEIMKYLSILAMSEKSHIYIIITSDLKDIGILPFFPTINKIKSSTFGTIKSTQPRSIVPIIIKEYCNFVESCTYYISEINNISFKSTFDFLSHAYIPRLYARTAKYFIPFSKYHIQNKAGQMIGLGYYLSLSDEKKEHLQNTGTFHFLPPPTSKSSTEVVQFLVNFLVGADLREDEPTWVGNVVLPNVDKLSDEITQRQKVIDNLSREIAKIKEKKNEIEKYIRLLWTNGTPLEEAVKDALFFLGFNEIKQGRSRDLEDWIIDIKSTDEFKHGVLEVKGSEKRISMDDISQCNKWVTQYRKKFDLKVKGILVPNQFRRTEKPSSQKRTDFAPNQMEWAQDINMCVLPTVEIFKAVVEILKGNKISRDEIERRILEADPLCILID